MKIKSCLVLFCALVLLASCSESPEKYNKRAFVAADSIISATNTQLYVATLVHDVWRNAIYDNSYSNPITNSASEFCYNWQDALVKFKVTTDMMNEKLFKPKRHTIDSLFKTIKEAPEKSQKILDNIKELYNVYLQTYTAATDPTGSLQDYTGQINALSTKFNELKNAIEIEKQ